MKRIFLFLATNIAVLAVINIILHITGLNRAHDTGSVWAYAAVVGFTGSIISLLLSKSKAKASAISLPISLLYSEHNVLVDTARSGISGP